MTTQIDMFKGDHKTLRLTVIDGNGDAVDLAGASLIFSLKFIATASTALIEKTSAKPAEIDILTPTTNGIAEIFLLPADTTSLRPKVYTFDVQLTDSGGKISTLLRGNLNLLQDVTN
jgi:hypothetical protein